MCENEKRTKQRRSTPLRNSTSANKPFRSPLTTVLTPRNVQSPRKNLEQSPLTKLVTPKRSISQLRLPLKRRKIEDADDPRDNDLLVLKKRIYDKRQELEKLRTKLTYIKKHKKEDLMGQIMKWRSAYKEALFQFHKDLKEKTSETLTVPQVLKMLGIPDKIVKFTLEECDLT